MSKKQIYSVSKVPLEILLVAAIVFVLGFQKLLYVGISPEGDMQSKLYNWRENFFMILLPPT